VYVLEVAARPIGGLCSTVLKFEGGQGLEHVLLQHAVGQSIAPFAREAPAAAVMMIPIPGRGMYKGVTGEDEARNASGGGSRGAGRSSGAEIRDCPRVNS
jgi:hypothetical protein